MASAPRLIKKYPNRRLYDTGISTYITLEDVRQLVVDGEDFEVREAASGRDITRAVLLQIIAEHESDTQPLLSPALLRRFICLHGDALATLMAPYLERSLDAFMAQQSALRDQLDSMVERSQASWKTPNATAADAPGNNPGAATS